MKRISFTEKKDTRSGFGKALEKLGEINPDVVALCADLTGSLKMNAFADKYPERFFQTGIAEANMIGMAAGMANASKIPYTGTFANFSTGRVYDQIRQSVAYSAKNVKICASHAGVTLGEDGATHQILEDLGMMKMLPGMTVINPCDYNQTYLATLAIAEFEGPVYLRFGRPAVPIFTSLEEKFEIGKAIKMNDGADVTIVATGHLVYEALNAAYALEEEGIKADVLNIHTIKPLDDIAILESVMKTGCVVSAEEHQMNGGLGDSVAQILSRKKPSPMEFVAVNDRWGQSGTPAQLMSHYNLNEAAVIKAVKKVIKRK